MPPPCRSHHDRIRPQKRLHRLVHLCTKYWLDSALNTTMTYILRVTLSVWLLAVAGVACAANISGTYVGLYSNAAELLQIVERPDGSILGHFEQVMLSSKGTKTTTMNAGVSGAVSGDTLVVTLKPAEFMGGTIPLSGSIDGDTLRLSGGANGGSFTVTSQRSTEAVFNQRVQQLTAQVSQTSVMQAEQTANEKERKDIGKLTQWMRDYSQRAAVHLQSLPKVPRAYAKFTEKMRAALRHEIQEPPNSVARSQTGVAIIQLGIQFGTWHYGLQSLESSFGYSDGKITNSGVPESVLRAQSYCGISHHKTDPICDSFRAAYSSYQDTVKQLEPLVIAAETAWHTEHAKQKTIETQASSLSN